MSSPAAVSHGGSAFSCTEDHASLCRAGSVCSLSQTSPSQKLSFNSPASPARVLTPCNANTPERKSSHSSTHPQRSSHTHQSPISSPLRHDRQLSHSRVSADEHTSQSDQSLQGGYPTPSSGQHPHQSPSNSPYHQQHHTVSPSQYGRRWEDWPPKVVRPAYTIGASRRPSIEDFDTSLALLAAEGERPVRESDILMMRHNLRRQRLMTALDRDQSGRDQQMSSLSPDPRRSKPYGLMTEPSPDACKDFFPGRENPDLRRSRSGGPAERAAHRRSGSFSGISQPRSLSADRRQYGLETCPGDIYLEDDTEREDTESEREFWASGKYSKPGKPGAGKHNLKTSGAKPEMGESLSHFLRGNNLTKDDVKNLVDSHLNIKGHAVGGRTPESRTTTRATSLQQSANGRGDRNSTLNTDGSTVLIGSTHMSSAQSDTGLSQSVGESRRENLSGAVEEQLKFMRSAMERLVHLKGDPGAAGMGQGSFGVINTPLQSPPSSPGGYDSTDNASSAAESFSELQFRHRSERERKPGKSFKELGPAGERTRPRLPHEGTYSRGGAPHMDQQNMQYSPQYKAGSRRGPMPSNPSPSMSFSSAHNAEVSNSPLDRSPLRAESSGSAVNLASPTGVYHAASSLQYSSPAVKGESSTSASRSALAMSPAKPRTVPSPSMPSPVRTAPTSSPSLNLRVIPSRTTPTSISKPDQTSAPPSISPLSGSALTAGHGRNSVNGALAMQGGKSAPRTIDTLIRSRQAADCANPNLAPATHAQDRMDNTKKMTATAVHAPSSKEQSGMSPSTINAHSTHPSMASISILQQDGVNKATGAGHSTHTQAIFSSKPTSCQNEVHGDAGSAPDAPPSVDSLEDQQDDTPVRARKKNGLFSRMRRAFVRSTSPTKRAGARKDLSILDTDPEGLMMPAPRSASSPPGSPSLAAAGEEIQEEVSERVQVQEGEGESTSELLRKNSHGEQDGLQLLADRHAERDRQYRKEEKALAEKVQEERKTEQCEEEGEDRLPAVGDEGNHQVHEEKSATREELEESEEMEHKMQEMLLRGRNMLRRELGPEVEYEDQSRRVQAVRRALLQDPEQDEIQISAVQLLRAENTELRSQNQKLRAEKGELRKEVERLTSELRQSKQYEENAAAVVEELERRLSSLMELQRQLAAKERDNTGLRQQLDAARWRSFQTKRQLQDHSDHLQALTLVLHQLCGMAYAVTKGQPAQATTSLAQLTAENLNEQVPVSSVSTPPVPPATPRPAGDTNTTPQDQAVHQEGDQEAVPTPRSACSVSNAAITSSVAGSSATAHNNKDDNMSAATTPAAGPPPQSPTAGASAQASTKRVSPRVYATIRAFSPARRPGTGDDATTPRMAKGSPHRLRPVSMTLFPDHGQAGTAGGVPPRSPKAASKPPTAPMSPAHIHSSSTTNTPTRSTCMAPEEPLTPAQLSACSTPMGAPAASANPTPPESPVAGNVKLDDPEPSAEVSLSNPTSPRATQADPNTDDANVNVNASLCFMAFPSSSSKVTKTPQQPPLSPVSLPQLSASLSTQTISQGARQIINTMLRAGRFQPGTCEAGVVTSNPKFPHPTPSPGAATSVGSNRSATPSQVVFDPKPDNAAPAKSQTDPAVSTVSAMESIGDQYEPAWQLLELLQGEVLSLENQKGTSQQQAEVRERQMKRLQVKLVKSEALVMSMQEKMKTFDTVTSERDAKAAELEQQTKQLKALDTCLEDVGKEMALMATAVKELPVDLAAAHLETELQLQKLSSEWQSVVTEVEELRREATQLRELLQVRGEPSKDAKLLQQEVDGLKMVLSSKEEQGRTLLERNALLEQQITELQERLHQPKAQETLEDILFKDTEGVDEHELECLRSELHHAHDRLLQAEGDHTLTTSLLREKEAEAEELLQQLQELRGNWAAFQEQQAVVAQSEIEEWREKLMRAEEDMEGLRRKVREMTRQAEEREELVEELKGYLESELSSSEKLVNQTHALEAARQTLAEEVAALTQQVTANQKLLQHKEGQIVALEEVLRRRDAECAQLQEQLDEVVLRKSKSSEALPDDGLLAVRDLRIAELEAEVQDRQGTLQGLELQLANLRGELVNLEQANKKLLQQLQESETFRNQMEMKEMQHFMTSSVQLPAPSSQMLQHNQLHDVIVKLQRQVKELEAANLAQHEEYLALQKQLMAYHVEQANAVIAIREGDDPDEGKRKGRLLLEAPSRHLSSPYSHCPLRLTLPTNHIVVTPYGKKLRLHVRMIRILRRRPMPSRTCEIIELTSSPEKQLQMHMGRVLALPAPPATSQTNESIAHTSSKDSSTPTQAPLDQTKACNAPDVEHKESEKHVQDEAQQKRVPQLWRKVGHPLSASVAKNAASSSASTGPAPFTDWRLPPADAPKKSGGSSARVNRALFTAPPALQNQPRNGAWY